MILLVNLLMLRLSGPGSVHDARVFANSAVQKNFTDKKFPMFYKELIPGEQPVPQLLLGDPAYPLLSHV